ncbi:AAA family ATPase [Nocardia sp. NPDC046473]|uniref:helix-turn-helix transcriptional regulator n=1 Tax=Nocardia sp. NPDC046473 TaxID=3155733 RepID=UPI0033FEBCDC
MLYGRNEEQRRLLALLDAAEAGRGGALFLVAGPGAGKSALLELAVELAGDAWQVLRCTGIQSEAELPFAGLQLLLSPVLGGLGALPERQRITLLAAFGVSPAYLADNRFLVGVGTTSLLTQLSSVGPVLCLIDDAQWLDRPSADALVFAARRLGAHRVAVLFAGRPEFAAPGVPELRLPPLDTAAARRLLAEHARELPGEIRECVLATAAGNPLALLELPKMNIDTLPVGPLPLPERLQCGYQGRIADQTADVRLALLVAAAEETGDLALVLRVLAGLGATADALSAAERSGMISVVGPSIAFAHPLQRAAAYRSAPFPQRLTVHAALAAALADQPDRRAWHLAAAATGPDETAAAALEAAAHRAYHRTGYATAAMALERAALLSTDRTARLRRLVRAVEAAADAGQPDRALRLADETERSTSPGPDERARLADVRARIEFERGSVRVAHRLLVDAAADIATAQPDRAAAMLIGAAAAAWFAGDLAEVAAARVRMAELNLGRQRAALLAVLDGPLAVHSADRRAGVRLIRSTVRSGRTLPDNGPSPQLTLAQLAMVVGDADDARDILAELTARCRDRGMVGWLPAVCGTLGTAEVLLGHFHEADAALTEGLRIAQEVDQPNRICQANAMLAVLAAIRGEEQRCHELAERCLRKQSTDFNAVDLAQAEWALGLLDLAYGRYEAAVDRLENLYDSPYRALGQWVHLMGDRVEAAVRLRRPDRARVPLLILEQWSAATHSPWIEACLLRCRGMLDSDGDAYARALVMHAAEQRWFDHARTGLLYGEWLRRERCKTEARSVLRGSLRTFERLDARPWADRARTELRAAGEAVAEPRSDLAALLTPQEFEVVRLAATGATNKEIGSKLLLSPKTVAHHLYRAFPKLGVTNRHGLAGVDLDTTAVPDP